MIQPTHFAWPSTITQIVDRLQVLRSFASVDKQVSASQS